jgi:hypothetical protein
MPAATETQPDTTAFDALDRALGEAGAAAALERLLELLAERGEFRALLDALLLKARHELGMPLIQAGTLADLQEPARTQYEERYVEAIRFVGQRLLDQGDIAGAWPYFRAIAEKEPVAAALERYEPAEAGDQLSAVIDVAFNQGAHPRKGFELILGHYGTCSAITAFDHLPPDEETRVPCAERLVRHLHEHLVASLRGDIARQGEPAPPDGASIPELLAGRAWLFADDAYHIDVSHLASTVRMALILSDPAALALAAELTDYGRGLSERHQYESDPPFERVYDDHGIYLRALLGQDVDRAIAHFRAKLPARSAEPSAYASESLPAQVLVRLLLRLGRLEEAIEVAAEHLAGLPESALICPTVAQLCAQAGQPARLAQIARDQRDLVHYLAAVLQAGHSKLL